jgi:hypothetical protein
MLGTLNSSEYLLRNCKYSLAYKHQRMEKANVVLAATTQNKTLYLALTEYKLNTWDILQKKGWTGPNFVTCATLMLKLQIIFSLIVLLPEKFGTDLLGLSISNSTWDGPNLSSCFDHWTHREHQYKHLPFFGLLVYLASQESNNF